MPAEPIIFFNRHTGRLETEAVYGEGFLRFVYGNTLGPALLHTLVKRAAFSRLYGWRMDRPASAAKIMPFIRQYGLDETEFAEPPESFRTFNEFFCRKLKHGARPVDATPSSIVFPADGRHLLIPDVSACDDFFIKGRRFDLAALLGGEALAEKFANGSLLISRLCPVDYHRFHFPCAGRPDQPRWIGGPLFSVSPIALRCRPSVLWENKRAVTAFESDDAGSVSLIEIGATCVGSIVHTSQAGEHVGKGDEKGYFRFGGSCVISVFQRGRVAWHKDLIEHGAAGREVYARMGCDAGVASGA